ncbi:hypothetical protein ABFU82_25840 [Nocardioides sp. WV_118_6]|uniref:hypothetical protein n=1 Tax=Pimelobacter TaxID=2044 RepID=UPI001C05C55C|nr:MULTISPECIES: hypothetical protein [Pimelobacter]MBU2694674.1 hypothetical protein [Pimelobacter sp. 30-1]UUW92034.1 hypothetical protein M0M43_11310 [Pimelobacter simplex]UUW95861.1 hypothetical protein M0M48_29810 [Pimelobacter simplex]
MTDLTDRLARLAAPGAEPAAETVRRDVARGRGAARRRAFRRGTAGLSLAAVAVVGGTIAVNADRTPAPAPITAAPNDAPRLVAYTGQQQPGFVVTKVPAGFVLEGATAYNLNVARADDHSGLDVFSDKLVVMLESQSVTTPPEGRPVRVGDHDGRLRTAEDGAQVLTYDDGEHRVVVQAWKSLGLSDEQVVEFAEGVTVTAEAQAGVG